MKRIEEVKWQQGFPCELPEQFDPFLTKVKGSHDFHTLGSLKRPESYYDDESRIVVEWIAKEYLEFILLEQNPDLSEATIRAFISSGNWIIEQLKGEKLEYEAIDDYKPITSIFQKIAIKTRSDQINRSAISEQGNKSIIERLHHVNKFLSHLYPNDTHTISDYLYHGKMTYAITEPPSEFCVVETVRYIAKAVKSEESQMNEAIAALEYKSNLNKNDILLFFLLSKNYRCLFLYLFIAVTGINGSNSMLIRLEDLDIDNDKKTSGKSVCVYKPRANRVISFEIPKDFLMMFVNPFVGLFWKYNLLCDKLKHNLKFEYIGRQVYDTDGGYRHISQYYLFRGWIKYNTKPKLISHLQQRLSQEGVIDDIKVPMPRDLRNYKATSLETKKGHNIAAIIMQHSTETAFKYYQKRQKKEAIENLGVFYTDFDGFIKNIHENVKKRLTVIPAGKCCATDNQKSIIELKTAKNAYIVGDCTTPTGCLFCSFFVVHADKDGVYKLISMREYILLKNKVLPYHSEFENSYGVVIERIDAILQYLKDQLKDEVVEWIAEAESKVPYGLHPDWQELYAMDMALLDVTS